jgi:flagellar basal body-associated protein FliL
LSVATAAQDSTLQRSEAKRAELLFTLVAVAVAVLQAVLAAAAAAVIVQQQAQQTQAAEAAARLQFQRETLAQAAQVLRL